MPPAKPAKLDLKRELKAFYGPRAKEMAFVDVPAINFLMVDGEGDPGSSEAYQQAVASLFGVAYAAKFAIKKAGDFPDFAVMPLEALWWADDMNDFVSGRRDRWKWTAMIAMPDFVTADDIDLAKETAAKKKELPAIGKLRFETFHEGPSAQILYVGTYADEGPTIAALHRFITDAGKRLRGRHHEIYLSDPRRTDPAKLKTVIRQPMA